MHPVTVYYCLENNVEYICQYLVRHANLKFNKFESLKNNYGWEFHVENGLLLFCKSVWLSNALLKV